MNPRKSVVACLGAAMVFLFAGLASAQTGTITGTVRNSETGEPVEGAQISIPGSTMGTLSQANGRFMMLNVPAGRHTLRVAYIGYATLTEQVVVEPNQTTTMNIQLEPEAIALQEIVVTGVAGATQRAKVPFEVGQVSAEDLPVPQINPASAIQGKVAGVTVVQGSGRPGDAASILLRGATSIQAAGRDQEPLYIVDGVILGSSLVDIDALDIENIEIVKGAAAASLYGSRAANGVIQITTKRGQRLRGDQVRYTIRTEYGQSSLGETPEVLLSENHRYAMSGGQFVNQDGTNCDWLLCTAPALAGNNAWDTYQIHAWPGQTYNQVERFFEGGEFQQHYVSAEGRAGATNYHVSGSTIQDRGIMQGLQGFERTNFRVNVDQTVLENVQVSASSFFSRSTRDLMGSGGVLFDLTRMPAGVDLLGDDPFEPGELVIQPDPTNSESPNPLYELYNRDYLQDRGRFLGSANLRYSAADWIDFDANASYDRLDTDATSLYPKGYRTTTPNSNLNDGYLYRDRDIREAFNGSMTATMRFNPTNDISNRTQFRYLYENQYRNSVTAGGSQFAVAGVPQIGNVNNDRLFGGSWEQTIIADGYFAITNFDIMDRYVVDALVRNDGSSLFGEDERRQTYYRLAGAWRMAHEPWFPVEAFDELKFRYSLGTAGGRPHFDAQYETYSVGGGRIRPVTLGNKTLKPEFSVEQEVGVDAALFGGKLVAGLTYANTVTEDQILSVPLPSYAGFSRQWRNAGTLESNTFEASLEMRLMQTQDIHWTARLLYDHTKSTITELNVPPFQYGVGGQGLGSVFYAREGEELGTFYGVHYATSCADLPEGMSCDGFTVNDDGWLVWTGTDPNFTWGISSDSVGVTVRGSPVMWGTPFAGECTDRSTGERTLFCPVGNSIPDFTVSGSSTFSWKGLTVYGLVEAVQGFDVYNQPLQWGVFKGWAGLFDEHSEEGKPIGYTDAWYGVSGLQPSNVFVEDGSFIKLREVSLSYRIGSGTLSSLPVLARFSSIGLSLTARNLITITDYSGYDPEVGETGGDTGSAAIARVDGYQYPNFRTWTAAIELIF